MYVCMYVKEKLSLWEECKATSQKTSFKNSGKDVWPSPWIAHKEAWPSPFGDSSMGGRAPGYRLSPDHFQTVKRMLVPDWAQKMLCIIVPNRRTASPAEFFSWARTRRLLSRHNCPARSRSFPNQERKNCRWVEKRFGCYQQEQFNLPWENSVSDGSIVPGSFTKLS